jgi:hypothetical protein
MAHHGHIDSESLHIAVLSTKAGIDEHAHRDEVAIQLYSIGFNVSFDLSPSDARSLAEKLTIAADAAEYREAKAA